MNDDATMRPGIPEYTAEWHPELELWAVLEQGFPLCYCPEQGSALYIAQACRRDRTFVMAFAEAHRAAARRASVMGLN